MKSSTEVVERCSCHHWEAYVLCRACTFPKAKEEVVVRDLAYDPCAAEHADELCFGSGS